MKKGEWQYYNHAWIPVCPPHIIPDTTPVENGDLFSCGGIFARYTTDYDCKQETEWWYVIKDDVFDISALSAKRRYVVRQGEKNFHVQTIQPQEYREEIFKVAEQAFAAYPKKYRPKLCKEYFFADMDMWISGGGIVFGAFFRETEELAGYAVLYEEGRCIQFSILKTVPNFEKMQVNAAIIGKVLTYFAPKLANDSYICNGARNIQHETNFPLYLEKYFMFRKAYCKLHIVYAPKYKGLVRFLYPFRKLFRLFDRTRKIHQLNGVLRMEEIVRRQRKKDRECQ